MIERFGEEQEKALQLLTALKRLAFMDCTSLQSPSTCDLPTSLEHLEFYYCTSLESLPGAIHRHSSLKKLVIHNCLKIQCLPRNGLPTSLQELTTYGCPNQLRIELQGLEETRPDVKMHMYCL
jgi:hypothetical protein